MTVLKPRYYQTGAVNSVFQFFRSKERGNPLIELPTGSGKSVVLGLICEYIHQRWPDASILVLSHVKEILEQDYNTLAKYVPTDKLGLYSSGLGMKRISQFTVAGIQSVWRRPEEFKHFTLVIIDEAHLIPQRGEGMYRTFLSSIGEHKIIGLTATPYRLGFGKLTDPGHIFSKIVYKAEIDTLIQQGYLAPLTSRAAKYQMDPTKERIKTAAGDYVIKQLAESFDTNKISRRICQELCDYKHVRKHWLVFAIDIEHAEHIAETLSALGVNAMYIHSKMSEGHRDEIIRLFKAGAIQALVNVAVLTTGFDFPAIDLVALLRPTRSPVLHVQMIGRGSRISEGKENCLVLDFAGNLQRLGPINNEFDFKAGSGKGEAPTKVCPKCEEVLYLSAKECTNCGHSFISERVSPLSAVASNAAVVGKINTYDVKYVYYHRHKKEGKPDSLKVTYMCGLKTITEWVGLENPRSRAHAEHWWKFRSGKNAPRTITEALERTSELKKPKHITVDESGKWPRIKTAEFAAVNGFPTQRKVTQTTDGSTV